MKPANTSCSRTPSLRVILGSTVYAINMVVSIVLFGPVVRCLKMTTFERRYAVAQLWIAWNYWVLGKVCGLTYRVEGLENIPAQPGVVICKHQSAWETIALQLIFPPLVSVLKKSLLQIPFWGWALATLKPIAITRSAKTAAMKQIIKQGTERIREGLWVVVFPEGTRVAPGERGRYMPGGGMLAHKAGCPVVPVAPNAGEFWKRNAYLKYPGVITVRIGPAIDGAKLSASEINQQAEEWIEAQMREISGVPYASARSDSAS
ncbi:MAG: 1-acyl-sn-glycerol-3-phosphate acyltransferase [Methylococcaceae bacterium]|nr:1-acyl-sn-glycerol-3-phosphate acyltransferase [Methylococcaceae bacterium]